MQGEGWAVVCGERWEASGDAGVVEEGGKLRVWLDSAFVLEVADFEVEAFDLTVELVYDFSLGDLGKERLYTY